MSKYKNILKPIALILLLFSIIPLLFSCTSRRGISASGVKAGMTADELSALLDSSETYVGYDGNRRLFRDKNNKSVTVTLSDDEKTVVNVSVETKMPKDSDFEKITTGMTLTELYDLLGAPIGSTTSGMYTETFASSTGKYYRIYLTLSSMDMKTTIVDSVFRISSDGKSQMRVMPITSDTASTANETK